MISKAWPIALMAMIFALSSIPSDDNTAGLFLGLVPPGLQNALHIPVFGLLAWLWYRALNPGRRRWLLAALICIGWSVLDEIHQLYVPGRYASATDLLLNTAGILIGLALAVYWPGTRHLQ